MATEFLLDESGKFQTDPGTGLPLVKRNGETVPLDLDKLFQGIADSNRDAAAKRKALEAANADLAEARAKIDALAGEMQTLKNDGGKPDPKESETERRIKALEESLAKEREDKKRIQAEQERREADRHVESAFMDSAFVAEHGHIPADLWLARYRSHCVFEEVNGVRCMVVKDANGNVIMSEKMPGNPARLDEALAVLCASRPKPGDIKLNPAPYGGSGSLPSHRAPSSSNPWMKGQENTTQQHKLLAEDPALAQRLAAAAGVRLPNIAGA